MSSSSTTARESILHKVRTSLGRTAGQAPPPVPPPLMRQPVIEVQRRVDMFCAALDKLAAKTLKAGSAAEARAYAEALVKNRRAVASNAPYLAEIGVTSLAGVESGFTDRLKLREACIHYDLGITCADYCLADTGTMVMISSREEARMISLLPPRHLAIIPRERILTGLDELLTLIPVPSVRSSSMVLITGPSRTADIEQILVRGVHGPGEVHVVVV
ncbi:MAG: lactate utilization protein [Bryobacterales bacterium]|nr:lactate utilization protein [Bryobacterales bacterium]